MPSSPPAVPPRPRPRRTAPGVIVGAVAGAVLVGVGGWLASRPVPVGWFAYAPLSETTYLPPRPPSHSLGLVALGAGLLLLGFVAGWVAARRRGGPVV